MVGTSGTEGVVVRQLEALDGESPLTLGSLRRLRRDVPTWYDMIPATREAHQVLESKLLALAEGGEAEGGEGACMGKARWCSTSRQPPVDAKAQ